MKSIHQSEEKNTKLSMKLVRKKICKDCLYSYKELCGLLQQDTYTGNKKIQQLNEFSRYFKYEKIDKKYLIKEVYDKIQPPLPNKIRKNSKFLKYIEYLLLLYLYHSDGYEIVCTRKQLWEKLGMVNHNYLVYGKDKNAKKELLNLKLDEDMNMAHVNKWFDYSSDKFYEILRNALNSLQQRSFIVYQPVLLIGDDYEHVHEATSEELSLWAEGRREVMEEYGLEREWEAKLLKGNEREEYFNELNRRTKEKTDSMILFQGIKIAFHHYGMDRVLKQNAEEMQDIRTKFNEVILDTIKHKIDSNLETIELMELLSDKSKEDDEMIKQLTDEFRIWMLLSDYLLAI